MKDLTAEQFRALLDALGDDVCLRTMCIVHLSLGLRISEVLGLKWCDVDWLGHSIAIERGVVKQVVADVKTDASGRTMPIADTLLEVLKQWKQVSPFSKPEDWIFASTVKLGRQPLSYTHVWENLTKASRAAGVGHVSSHAFRNAFRTWIDSLGTPVGVQQRLMRHASVTTTMNHYGTALEADMRAAHEKVLQLAQVSTGFNEA
jgi:integrase